MIKRILLIFVISLSLGPDVFSKDTVFGPMVKTSVGQKKDIEPEAIYCEESGPKTTSNSSSENDEEKTSSSTAR